MNFSFFKCFLCLLVILFTVLNFLQAQNDPTNDSLQNLVNLSKGDEKVLNLIHLSEYYWRVKNYQESNQAANKAFRLAENTPNKKHYYDALKCYWSSMGSVHKKSEVVDTLSKYLDSFIKRNDKKGEFWALYYLSGHFTFSQLNDQLALEYSIQALNIAEALNETEMLYSIFSKLSTLYHYQGLPENEEKYYFKNLNLYASQDWNATAILLDIARFYVNHGEYAKSIEYFRKTDSAISLREDMEGMEHSDKCFLRAKQTGNIARAFRLWGRYDSALIFHRLAIKQMYHCIAQLHVDIANQMEGIGIIYTHWGILDSAKVNFQKSIQIREDCHDWLGVGYSLDGLGYISHLIGDYEGAVNLYFKALNEKLKENPYPTLINRVFSLKEAQSISHLRLGLVYTDWNYPETALDEFNQSLNLCREIGFASGETEALVGIGKLYIRLKKFTEAEKFLEQALQKSRETDDLPLQATTLKSIGILNIEKGDLSKAIQYLTESKNLCITTGNPSELAEVEFNLGKTEYLQRNDVEAEKRLSNALLKAQPIRLGKLAMDCHELLTQVYERSGNIKLAYSHAKLGSDLRDSLFSRQADYYLADLNENNEDKKLQIQLEVEEKARETKNAELAGHRNRLLGLTGLGLLLFVVAYAWSEYYRLRVQNHQLVLQQKIFRTRMNPSFINTSINDLDNMLDVAEPGKAVDYISTFARYIQEVLQSMRDESITLDREFVMISHYLDLKKSAYPDSFNYSLQIDPDFESGSKRILPLTIRPALDGIINKMIQQGTQGGMLKISVTEKENSVVMVFEDNTSETNQANPVANRTTETVWNRTTLEFEFINPARRSKPFNKFFLSTCIIGFLLMLLPVTSIAESNVLNSSINELKALSLKFESQNNYDSAFYYLKLFIQAKKEKDSIDHVRDVKSLGEKYQIETKQARLDLVKHEKTLRELEIKRTRYSIFGISGVLSITFLFWLLHQNRKRLRSNREIGRAEQYLLLAQMNPHFVYNALTNIQSLIVKHDNLASHQYLGYFRDLTAKILENSALDTVSLGEELQIISSYLNLQKLRYSNKFDTTIEVDNDQAIADVKIPPMILQPLVENAIEHGLRHKEGTGLLCIRIRSSQPEYLSIEIEDNGIGRKKAMELAAANPGKHHGLATAITRERIDRINREKKMKIAFEINDLNDNTGNASGTLIKITISNFIKL